MDTLFSVPLHDYSRGKYGRETGPGQTLSTRNAHSRVSGSPRVLVYLFFLLRVTRTIQTLYMEVGELMIDNPGDRGLNLVLWWIGRGFFFFFFFSSAFGLIYITMSLLPIAGLGQVLVSGVSGVSRERVGGFIPPSIDRAQ